jgi:hypothetical protein
LNLTIAETSPSEVGSLTFPLIGRRRVCSPELVAGSGVVANTILIAIIAMHLLGILI